MFGFGYKELTKTQLKQTYDYFLQFAKNDSSRWYLQDTIHGYIVTLHASGFAILFSVHPHPLSFVNAYVLIDFEAFSVYRPQEKNKFSSKMGTNTKSIKFCVLKRERTSNMNKNGHTLCKHLFLVYKNVLCTLKPDVSAINSSQLLFWPNGNGFLLKRVIQKCAVETKTSLNSVNVSSFQFFTSFTYFS